jgi:hypothetical protein
MSNACPISNETVDERAARLCAGVVLVLLALSLSLGSPWIALFLAGDFGLRGLGARRWSPVARLSQVLASSLGLAPRPTNAAPKVFAARLGLGFSLLVTFTLLAGADTLALAAGVPFALCAFLEGVLGFCVGCRIYQLWPRLLPDAGAADAPVWSR